MPTVKSANFTVESYKVQVKHSPNGPEHTLTLTSPPSLKGIRTQATILFQKTNPFSPGMGAVETSLIELVSWSDPALFDSMYSVLVTEKPVIGNYEYTVEESQPKNTSWNLQSMGLATSDEAPGDFEK